MKAFQTIKTVTTWHIRAIKVGGEASPSHDLYLKISSHGDRLLITAPTSILTLLFFFNYQVEAPVCFSKSEVGWIEQAQPPSRLLFRLFSPIITAIAGLIVNRHYNSFK